MEDEVLIDDNNITEFLEQDLKSLEILKDCPELNIDTTPEPLDPSSYEKESGRKEQNSVKPVPRVSEGSQIYSKYEERSYKICKCGNIIYKNHKLEFRCGVCGCILF